PPAPPAVAVPPPPARLPPPPPLPDAPPPCPPALAVSTMRPSSAGSANASWPKLPPPPAPTRRSSSPPPPPPPPNAPPPPPPSPPDPAPRVPRTTPLAAAATVEAALAPFCTLRDRIESDERLARRPGTSHHDDQRLARGDQDIADRVAARCGRADVGGLGAT